MPRLALRRCATRRDVLVMVLGQGLTLIGLGEVYRELESSGAGLKVLLVDACRNDPQSDNSRAGGTITLESVSRPQRRPPPGGVVALFSCSEGEKAFEHADLKHGVFFHFVTEGLRGSMRRMAVMIESRRCVWAGLLELGPPPLLKP